MFWTIVCVVLVGAICVFNAIFIPKRFFGALSLAARSEYSKEFSSPAERYRACERETRKLFWVGLIGTIVCVACSFLDGLHASVYRDVLSTVAILTWGVIAIWLVAHIKKSLTSNGVSLKEAPPGARSQIFYEQWISACFLYPYFAFIYQLLVLIF